MAPINNQGDAENDDLHVSRGFVWTDADRVMQEIHDGQQDTFTAQDINESGDVVGTMVVNGEIASLVAPVSGHVKKPRGTELATGRG